MTAFTRMLRIATSVDPIITATATGTAGSPGTTVAMTEAMPSAATGGKSTLLKTLTPSMTKPAMGPSVCATATYSPPATGQAEESSA